MATKSLSQRLSTTAMAAAQQQHQQFTQMNSLQRRAQQPQLRLGAEDDVEGGAYRDFGSSLSHQSPFASGEQRIDVRVFSKR